MFSCVCISCYNDYTQGYQKRKLSTPTHATHRVIRKGNFNYTARSSCEGVRTISFFTEEAARLVDNNSPFSLSYGVIAYSAMHGYFTPIPYLAQVSHASVIKIGRAHV